MNAAQLKAERPNHKAENTFFADTDDNILCVYGVTEKSILAHHCYFDDDVLMLRPMCRFPFARFQCWVESDQISQLGSEALYLT